MWDDERRRLGPKKQVFEYLFIAPPPVFAAADCGIFFSFLVNGNICVCAFALFFVSIFVTPDNDAFILPGRRSRGKNFFFCGEAAIPNFCSIPELQVKGGGERRQSSKFCWKRWEKKGFVEKRSRSY